MFAANLAYLLETQDIRPEELALAIHSTPEKILAYQQGTAEPGTDELIALSRRFSLTIDRFLKVDIRKKNQIIRQIDIRLIIMDIDGVLTDGGMYYAESGDEIKRFNTKDGMALKRLRQTHPEVRFGVISSGYNFKLINKRSKFLGIEYVYTGNHPKIDILSDWCTDMGITMDNVAFLGDDINDLDCMVKSGVSACPSDAVDRVKEVADIVLIKGGGHGCVREFIDEYLEPAMDERARAKNH